jgi:ATP-dependent DNA ligase
VFDQQIVSRVEWLRAQPKGDVATPPIPMAFDLLELDGEDQRSRPLRERSGPVETVGTAATHSASKNARSLALS